MNFFKNNKKIVVIFIVVVVLVPIILFIENPWGVGIVSKELGYALLQYFGTVLTGFLAIYGVIWTIEENRKQFKITLEENRNQHNEDRAIEYRPIINYDFVSREKGFPYCVGEILFTFNNQLFNNTDLKYVESMLVLTNIGRGEVEDLDISVSEFSLTTHFIGEIRDGFLEKVLFFGNQYINFIPVNGKVYIKFGFPSVRENMRDFVSNGDIALIKFTLSMRYRGLFSNHVYEQFLNCNVEISYRDGKYSCNLYNSYL